LPPDKAAAAAAAAAAEDSVRCGVVGVLEPGDAWMPVEGIRLNDDDPEPDGRREWCFMAEAAATARRVEALLPCRRGGAVELMSSSSSPSRVRWIVNSGGCVALVDASSSSAALAVVARALPEAAIPETAAAPLPWLLPPALLLPLL